MYYIICVRKCNISSLYVLHMYYIICVRKCNISSSYLLHMYYIRCVRKCNIEGRVANADREWTIPYCRYTYLQGLSEQFKLKSFLRIICYLVIDTKFNCPDQHRLIRGPQFPSPRITTEVLSSPPHVSQQRSSVPLPSYHNSCLGILF